MVIRHRLNAAALVCVALLGSLVLTACATDDGEQVALQTAPPPARPVVPAFTPPTLAPAPEDAPSAWSEGEPVVPHPPFDATDPHAEKLQRLSEALLAAPMPAPATSAPWDHKAPPKFMDAVTNRYLITRAERDLINRQGFAVAERLPVEHYAGAFHDLYQSDMPIYVTADAILHAVFVSHDEVLEATERKILRPWITALVDALHSGLGATMDRYPEPVAHDLDVYLTVASRLIHNDNTPTLLPDDDTAASLVERITRADALAELDLFGRPRLVDFSMYRPRGHYADTEQTEDSLEPYFRAFTWLSRLEFNLVSRSCRSSQPGEFPNPEETPREALVALALADLVEATHARPALDGIESTLAAFAGKRQDVPPTALADLAASAHIDDLRAPDAFDRLAATIGDKFPRSARLHPMPQGTTTLPVITSLIGERAVGDATALEQLVHTPVPDRYMVQPWDIAYALGHDRALTHHTADLTTFPDLRAQLDRSRTLLAEGTRADDLYATWLRAIAGLAEVPAGQRPSFMATDAFSDLRLSSALVAYGQLRHNNVLLAGQPYDMGGCDPLDIYVEPAPATYHALIDFARSGRLAVAGLDPTDATRIHMWFERVERILAVLLRVSEIELSGAPLPPDALEFLKAIAEMEPASTGGPAQYNGWYFQLFYEGGHEPWSEDRVALRDGAFIADYYTSANLNQVAYLGAHAPTLAFFVVDTAGPPRLMVGPVARAWAHVGPLATRLTDAEAADLPRTPQPWDTTTTAPPPPEPNLALTFEPVDDRPEATMTVQLRSDRPLTVRVVTISHHGTPVREKTARATKRLSRFEMPVFAGEQTAEGVRIEVGEWVRWIPFNAMESPSADRISVGGAQAIPFSWEVE